MAAPSSAASAHSELPVTGSDVPEFLKGVDKNDPAYRFFNFLKKLQATIPDNIQARLPSEYRFTDDKFLVLRYPDPCYRKRNDMVNLSYDDKGSTTIIPEHGPAYITVIKDIIGEGFNSDGLVVQAIRKVQKDFEDVGPAARRAYFLLMQEESRRKEEEWRREEEEQRKNAMDVDGDTNGGSSRRTSLGGPSRNTADSGRRSSSDSWKIVRPEDGCDGSLASGDEWDFIQPNDADAGP